MDSNMNNRKPNHLALRKYYALDIETNAQEIQEEETLWTDFVYEEEDKDVKPGWVVVEQEKKVVSKQEEVEKEVLVSTQNQDP